MKNKYILLALSFCFLSFQAQATTYYVKTGGNNSSAGTSWSTAKADLQHAINLAVNTGDEVWIAAGTYKPTHLPSTGATSTSSRDLSFYLYEDIKIYGGFAGTETALGQRNSTSNPVILSGDIGTQNDSTDNCYHVFITDGLSSAAVLDGVTITYGNANGSGTITHSGVVFDRDKGGGLYVTIDSGYTSPTLVDVIINYNTAAFGGGMYNGKSSASLFGLNIHNNTSTNNGGGMYNYDSPLTLSGVTIENNSCVNEGGGMNNQDSDTIEITESSITGNNAAEGGGIYNSNSSIVMNGALVSNNGASSSTSGGGGILNQGTSTTALTAVIISGNTATTYGGGILNTDTSTTTLTNVIISGNSANFGGGIVNNASSLTIMNASIYGNAATSAGGGLVCDNNSTITNTIFWGNTKGASASVAGADIYTPSGTVTITNSLTQENSSYSTGTGMINNQNPLFLNASDPDGADNSWLTADDGLNINYSPAYHTGTSSGAPTTDITGEARGSSPSMGAYEGYILRLYVDKDATGTGDGTSWTDAFTTLQPTLNAATAGDSVFIAEGTYKPTLDPSSGTASGNTRDYAFYLDKDIKIYGGFAGTETALSQRNSTSNPVILSGDLGGNSPTTITDDCYHVFITDGLSSAAVLDGVTITYGNGNASGSSSITYSGQTIYKKFGGGMYNISSSPTLTNVTISGNTANHAGGGMYNYSSSPILTNVTISGNTVSAYHGGGIYNSLSSPTLTNVTISGNTANGMGGGIFNFQSGSSPTIINTIFWGNAKGTSAATNVAGADIENANSASVTITYSLVQLASTSYTSGNNNLLTTNTNMIYNTDPSFVNSSDPDGADNVWMTADDGLRLASGSPAAGAGTSSGTPTPPTTDIIGKDRPSTPGIGAYEGIYCTSSNALPTTVSTTYTSSYKSTDTNGWTHYCDASDKLLLSLEIGSSGAVIAKDEVELKLGASTVYTSTSTGGLVTNSGGYSIIDRRWSVIPTTQPSNGNVGVRSYFTATEVSAVNTALGSSSVYNSFDDLQMFKAQTNVTGGGTATAFAHPHTVNGIVLINGGTATASTTVWEDGTHGTSDHFAEFEVSSFSGGGGGGGANGAALPVELVYFEAKAIDNHQALLNWQTASELNNNYFDVERSYDVIHWEWVGKVAGNGTTTQLTDYSFVDKTIAKSQQIAYYRLNQIDYDGANEYTDIRSVRFTVKPNAFEIAAYPNPFNQEVTISVNTTELYSIEVTDLSGVLLLAIQNEDKGTHRLDLSAWASGVYIVNVTSTQGTKHLKVIKQ